jgi:hypothetical protein
MPPVGDRSFLVDVIASGSVLGMGVGDTPEQVAGRLGDSFLEDKTRSSMRRDYGLVEFFWSRMSSRGPWLSAGFTVQVHRLATDPGLRDGRWARLGPRVPFASLRADLAPLGFQCAEITVQADRPDWRRYWHAEALIAIQVARTPWTGVLRTGDVFAIHAPYTAATVAADRMRSRRQSIRDGLAHLLTLDDDGRRAWLDRRQPAAADRVNWWLYLLVVIDSRLSGSRLGDQAAGRPDWVDLRIWLMDEGVTRGLLSPGRHAADMAYFVLVMRASRAASPSLPTADEVVRACLDAIAVEPEQAIARDGDGNLTTFDRAVVLPSRQANALVSAAQWHLDALGDLELAGRLQEWMSFRHLLA